MTPLEAAAEKAIPRERGSVTPLPHDIETARAIITAFLDAAMADQTACGLVGDSLNLTWRGGKIAIRALKEVL